MPDTSANPPSGIERPIDRLLRIMARLRDPRTGCPWDIEQTFATIAPYTIEEAYEVADAIARNDMGALREELGDLLLQPVYHAQMAAEAGLFDFNDVATAVADKLEARHPHVFGDAAISGVAMQNRAWEVHKAEERRRKAEAAGRVPSVLDDVPLALPALMRAEKLQKRAARVGFDWPETTQVIAKIEEEVGELRAELPTADKARLTDELGDILFAVANLARHLGIDPEVALRGTNAKFEQRFQAIETGLAAIGKTPDQATLEEMEALWQAAKRKP